MANPGRDRDSWCDAVTRHYLRHGEPHLSNGGPGWKLDGMETLALALWIARVDGDTFDYHEPAVALKVRYEVVWEGMGKLEDDGFITYITPTREPDGGPLTYKFELVTPRAKEKP